MHFGDDGETAVLIDYADEGRVKVLKVDVDKNQALAMAARIRSIPTLFFITKDGDIERQVGALPYQELTRLAERIINSF